ncbi:MAG: bifunctional oligoribonuclease/PAP phosphatase NrnA [Acidimicrobiia bacterium]|nr:bifunctional oligoribonuclease/PAP phosphatase NrnA [Acidimicrobiia bacterium]
MSDSLRQAAAAISRAESIVAMGHIGPDGDALGSMLAIARGAANAGKKACATFGEPFVVGKQFTFLDMALLVPPGEVPESVDVAVVVDTSVAGRLGSALPIVERAATVVVVDHHLSQDAQVGDIHVVDTSAGAAAQVTYRLFRELGWEIDKEMATALYVGIVTDTGRFQYSATSPEVHRITAELIEAGVEPAEVSRHVYEESPFAYLGVAGSVLSRCRLEADKRLVWSLLTREDLAAAELKYEDADGLIDLIRIAEESDVACLLRELGDDKYKGSLRSRGRVDVSKIAAQFGGGGHHNAAGFVSAGPLGEILDRIGAELT